MSRSAAVKTEPMIADPDRATDVPDESVRPKRADARRNHEKLVAAAREAFLTSGDASLEGIAKRAGVGIGTLYRNFPSRRALLEAVYVDEVEALCAAAPALADELGPWEALASWLDSFVDYVVTKHALVEEMLASMTKDDPVFKTCHTAILAAGQPLLERAQAAGEVRADLEFVDLIRMVGCISTLRNSTPEEVRRILGVALDGTRYRP